MNKDRLYSCTVFKIYIGWLLIAVEIVLEGSWIGWIPMGCIELNPTMK